MWVVIVDPYDTAEARIFKSEKDAMECFFQNSEAVIGSTK